LSSLQFSQILTGFPGENDLESHSGQIIARTIGPFK
jgi:hypothetical protein